MKIAFLADPLASFKTYKDSTFAMMREAARRGHAIYAFEQTDIVLESGLVTANVARITLTGEADDWYRAEAAVSTFLSEFDAIVIRKDPPFDMEYIYTTYLLELAEKQGARVFNKPEAIRSHNEKLAIAQFPQYTAPTLVTRDAKRLRAFHAEHKDVILKPLDGMGGMGIFRIGQDGMNLGSVIETLTDNGNRTIMAQRFIPEISKGDKRILLIGGKVVPHVLARIPQGGEVRGNLAAKRLRCCRHVRRCAGNRSRRQLKQSTRRPVWQRTNVHIASRNSWSVSFFSRMPRWVRLSSRRQRTYSVVCQSASKPLTSSPIRTRQKYKSSQRKPCVVSTTAAACW